GTAKAPAGPIEAIPPLALAPGRRDQRIGDAPHRQGDAGEEEERGEQVSGGHAASFLPVRRWRRDAIGPAPRSPRAVALSRPDSVSIAVRIGVSIVQLQIAKAKTAMRSERRARRIWRSGDPAGVTHPHGPSASGASQP